MLKLYGSLAGRSNEIAYPVTLDDCTKRCFSNEKCIVASWNGTCFMYELLLFHEKTQQVLNLTRPENGDNKNVVVIKSLLKNTSCPSSSILLSNSILGSITPPLHNKPDIPFTYQWARMPNGWAIKQCSACVLSKPSGANLCVKLYNSEQLNATYIDGFTYAQALEATAKQRMWLLGVASQEEVDFVLKSRPIANTESYWIGGKAYNCANGICKNITWTDSWGKTGTFKQVPSPVPNPCLAVINNQVVGRDCNDKLIGALCAWSIP